MISHIYKNLYIGNANDVHDTKTLDELGITSIVNVALDLDDGWNNKQRFFKAGITDGENNKFEHYLIAYNLLVALLYLEDEKVLLHCHEGRSRSAFIGTLALSKQLKIDHQEAYDLICNTRPLCNKMNDFFKQLLGVK